MAEGKAVLKLSAILAVIFFFGEWASPAKWSSVALSKLYYFLFFTN